MRSGSSPHRPIRAAAVLFGLLLAIGTIPAEQVASPAAAAATSAVPDSLRQQWQLVSRPAITLAVPGNGLYRVTAAALRRAGLPAGTDPRRLALWTDGRQVALRLLNTGSFERDGAIEFYGRALHTPTTGVRTYWLTETASSPLRIPSRRAPAPLAPPAGSYPASTVLSPHELYFPLALGGSGTNIFGPLLDAADPVTETVGAPGLAASASSATLSVTLQGVSLGGHTVRVALAGHPLGTINFKDRNAGTGTWTVSASWLGAGGTTVGLTAPSTGDSSLLASIRLTYPHAYVLAGRPLRIPSRAGSVVRLDVLDSSRVTLLDLTVPDRPVLLRPSIARTGHGLRIALRIPSQPAGKHTLLAATTPLDLAGGAVRPSPASTWHAATDAADLVIIAYRQFLPALAPLIRLREREGLRVTTVPVDEIYDEFGYGVHGPEAIRAFLQWARSHWRRAPRYALLAGSASYDPRDLLRDPSDDFVPTKLIDTVTMQTASDEWLVDFNNDGEPQMALGRLPARSLAEMRTLVSKIVAYRPPPLSALIVADSPNAPYDYKFGDAAARLAGAFPAGTAVRTLVSDNSGTGMHAAIVAALNAGPRFLDYAGHGNVDRWSRNDFFDNAAAGGLTNRSRLSIAIMMTCLNGYFIAPTIHSLAETLLVDPRGGAVAAWASTGETVAQSQIDLNAAFYAALLGHPNVRLGDAILQAARTVKDDQVRRTWVLLGDPTLPGAGAAS